MFGRYARNSKWAHGAAKDVVLTSSESLSLICLVPDRREDVIASCLMVRVRAYLTAAGSGAATTC